MYLHVQRTILPYGLCLFAYKHDGNDVVWGENCRQSIPKVRPCMVSNQRFPRKILLRLTHLRIYLGSLTQIHQIRTLMKSNRLQKWLEHFGWWMFLSFTLILKCFNLLLMDKTQTKHPRCINYLFNWCRVFLPSTVRKNPYPPEA